MFSNNKDYKKLETLLKSARKIEIREFLYRLLYWEIFCRQKQLKEV